MTAPGPPSRGQASPALRDFPQAIADDYPGWTITCDQGAWAASCPAMTVYAGTPDGLRAAIEQAISPDDDDSLGTRHRDQPHG